MKVIKISGLYSEAVLKQPRFFINLVMIDNGGTLQNPKNLFVLTFAFWIFYYEQLHIFFNGMIV